MPLRPERLQSGDKVGIVAPASPPLDPKLIEESVSALERYGFKPVLGKHTRERNGFLAGSDSRRAQDLMRFFADKSIKAIVCVRGGYGSARLLEALDYDIIRKNPKIFLGFSDITSLHTAILKKTGLITFHGPMMSTHLAKKDMPPFTRNSLVKTLMEAKPPGSICEGMTGPKVQTLHKGRAGGILVGGNLVVFAMMVGTPWWISLKNKILFLEEIDEAPYRIDRLLTFLINTGALKGVAGVAIGQCTRCEDVRENYKHPNWMEVFAERLAALKIPVAAGFPFGHVPMNATLPVGAKVELDATAGDLVVTQAAVL